MKYSRIYLINSRPNDEEFTNPFIDEATKYGVAVKLIDASTVSFSSEPSGKVAIYDGVDKLDIGKDVFVYFRRTKGERVLGALLGWVLDSEGVDFNDHQAHLYHRVANSKLSQSFRLAGVASFPHTWVTGIGGYRLQRDRMAEFVGFPCVLKTDGANGEHVWKINNAIELSEKVEAMNQERSEDGKVFMLQKIVPNSFDIRAIVFRGEVLSAISRAAGPGEFHNNISKGGTAGVIELTAEETKVAIEATRKLGLELGGVDIVRTPEGVRLFEVNKSPGVVNDVVKDSNVRKIVNRLLVG